MPEVRHWKMIKHVTAVLIAFVAALIVLADTAPASADDGYQPSLAAFGSVEECRRELAKPVSLGAQTLDGSSIRLVSWNIKKGSLSEWQADLQQLALHKDLVLIQEATTDMEEIASLPVQRAFAPGYISRTKVSGVATFSHVSPTLHCHLQAVEPWLRSPKATNITRYALANSDQTLLVANIHMINFALGQRVFRGQLEELLRVLRVHDGPKIVAGDFNTWSQARYQTLLALLGSIDAVPITFDADERTQFFGSPLDHVFVAGLKVKRGTTSITETSDHNPISVELSL